MHGSIITNDILLLYEAMPLGDFHGQTFLAFTDISGFKQLMRQRNRAMDALHNFYSHGFEALRSQPQVEHIARVEGLFISDCAVLFVRPNEADHYEQLRALLSIVQSINRQMLQDSLMLTTSIAYGHFDYSPRQEFNGIEKNLLHGSPYLEAYLDQSTGSPKLEPGQCRILLERMPFPDFVPLATDEYFSRVRTTRSLGYFYWMCNSADQIDSFTSLYHDAYNQKYLGMLTALKQYGL